MGRILAFQGAALPKCPCEEARATEGQISGSRDKFRTLLSAYLVGGDSLLSQIVLHIEGQLHHPLEELLLRGTREVC